MAPRHRTLPENPAPPEPAELSIVELGGQGDGIARLAGGETVFVPFTVSGDRVRARLGARRAGGREARVAELLVAGPGRAAPVCRHFGRCALQHLDAEGYRRVKLGALGTALQRVGIDPAVVTSLRAAAPDRRRARLGLRPGTVGFRERFSHSLVDLRECAVLEPALFALVDPLRRLRLGAAEAMLTRTDSGVDMLVEAAEAPDLAALEALAGFAERHDLARIVWRARGGDIPVVERRRVRVMLSGVAVPFPPGGFLQASAAAEAILADEVVAAVGAARPVLDLYAGLGTFALALGGAVHAVEGNAEAVAALAASGAASVTVERRDLDRDPVPAEALARYAAVVFDPPRAGALRQAAALAGSPVPVVVAVSCNPATFARDAARLVAGGYRLDRVVPVDQFVWTPHLELVGVFRR